MSREKKVPLDRIRGFIIRHNPSGSFLTGSGEFGINPMLYSKLSNARAAIIYACRFSVSSIHGRKPSDFTIHEVAVNGKSYSPVKE